MGRQRYLPGISGRTTSGDIKALVKARLNGLEYRQEERARRRERQGKTADIAYSPAQQELFPELISFSTPTQVQEISIECPAEEEQE